jgi:putative NADH-flavin reductase
VSAVVVFGANGATGHVIVEEALRAGHSVTAAVRDPATFRPVPAEMSNAPLDVVHADVRDPAGVRAAVDGHDAVVSAIGPAGRRAGGLYSAAARALATAMDATGVDRRVALSSSGARNDDPNHPLWYRAVARTLLRELYTDMRLMEDIVRASGLDWTLVRPTRIVDEPSTGRYRVQVGANPKGGTAITRADLARFVVQAIDGDRWSRTFPTLAR